MRIWMVVAFACTAVVGLAGASGADAASASSGDFSLSATPASLSVQVAGKPASTTITVTRKNGFSGDVSLTAGKVPGVTATINGYPWYKNRALTVKATPTASAGHPTITVTGKSGSKTHTLSITLAITAPAAGLTRGDPFPLGTAGTVPDWKLRVNNVNFNAWSIIHAVNEFNTPPPAGWTDVLVNMTMTYKGSGTADPSLEDNLSYVGSSNVGYTWYEHSCGVLPNLDIENDDGPLFPGGAITGYTCVQVPQAQTTSLVAFWTPDVSDSLSWFALR